MDTYKLQWVDVKTGKVVKETKCIYNEQQARDQAAVQDALVYPKQRVDYLKCR